MNNLIIYLIIILLPTTLSFVFIHMNYKKYPVITKLNEIMLFKKMLFNKKIDNCAGEKTTVSFFFLIVGYTFFIIVGILYALLDSAGIDVGALLISLFIYPIIRLIYEYVVIPNTMSNNETVNYSQNAYVQHPLQQSNVTSYQTDINTQSQQTVQNPLPTDNQFKFCSQCGTCYNASDNNCPNCGMQ